MYSIGIDDSPFAPEHRGDVLVVGAIFSGTRMEGVLSAAVRRDGANATRVLAQMIGGSRFGPAIQLIMLQGIALGGFNVIDAPALSAQTGKPVLIVARRLPNMAAVRAALETKVRGGARKWRLIEQLGPMEPAAGVYVQRVGLSLAQAEQIISSTAVHGRIPEPLRVAHLIAGGVVRGASGGRT